MLECASWIGVSQSLFAAITIITKADRSISDRVLSAFLFLMSLLFLSTALYVRIYQSSLLTASFLLFNPAIYIYINSLVKPNYRLKAIQLLHLIPFALFGVVAFIKYVPYTPSLFLKPGPDFAYKISFAITNLLSWAIYIPLSISKVHRYRISLKGELSNIDKNEKLEWLLFITIFYILYSFAVLISASTAVLAKIDLPITEILNYSLQLILLYIVSFYGIRQKELQQYFYPKEESEETPYKSSHLTDSERAQIGERIVQFFEKEKPHLRSDLSMAILSEELDIPKYQLTEVLNRELGHNFFQWVNIHRVEEVKKMLQESRYNHYSLEAIGYECGFSNKSSFYSFFKSVTGMTPLQYRQKRASQSK